MIRQYFHRAAVQYYADKAPLFAAGITLYIALALAPLLIVLIHVFAIFLGTDLAKTYALQALGQFLPTGADALWQNVQTSLLPIQSGIAVVVFSIIIALITVSGAIIAVQDVLHTLWGVKAQRSLKHTFMRRIFSIAFIILIGVLLLSSALSSVVISIIAVWLQSVWQVPSVLMHIINSVVFLVLVSTLLYYVQTALSQVILPRKAVVLSCTVTAGLFLLGQIALTYYFSIAVNSATGVVGSIFVVLLWMYYLIQVCLFGVELSKAYVVVHKLPVHAAPGYTL
jgi:membrane protein